ncbi:hypothetical protein [Treponema pedis]|uniref:hypothetical protein n=1 Tax=Treponema pedis TaxID=409322 RepID=UPI0004207C48|nr:hypothetical protein [Treponema pedis]
MKAEPMSASGYTGFTCGKDWRGADAVFQNRIGGTQQRSNFCAVVPERKRSPAKPVFCVFLKRKKPPEIK